MGDPMQQNSLDRPCEICGDEGYAELIATCSKCNKSREHIYCMRNNLLEFPEFWKCEACQCPIPHTRHQEPVNAAVCCEDVTSNANTCLTFEEEDLPNPPAVNASWKGSFEIVDSPHELYDGFQAYPPRKALSKTYSVSTQMPRVLQFTLQPRCKVWQEIFQTASPSGFDIALYFCADNSCRSKEKYVRLVGLMEKQDLSIKSHLDGTELLIFTSRHLPSESQRMNKQFYLWGVFLSLKGQKSSVDLKGKQHAVDFPMPNKSLNEYSATISHEVDDQVVDMEIDMVGGREVGSVDKFLRSNSTAACWDNSDVPSRGEQLKSKVGEYSACVPHEVDVHVVDMEIDMVGGREVGTVDKILRSNSRAACWHGSDVPSQDLFARLHSDQLIEDSQRKTEQCDVFEVPPGSLRSANALEFARPVISDAADKEPIATSLVKMSPVVLKVDPPSGICKTITPMKMAFVACDAPPGFSKSINLEEKGSSSKMEQGLGMHQNLASDDRKHIAGAESTIRCLEGVEEKDLACKVCREGYTSRPNDMLGIYSYGKQVNISTGTSANSCGEFVYTTVSRFNIIHFQCHREAKRADAALKNPKKEWEGAKLRNDGDLCNCIFPLRGPFVPMLQYVRFVGQYWDNLNVLGRADGNRLHLLTYDIVLMLDRFATGAPFGTDNKGGGRRSNSRFLLFMIQMARHLVDQRSSTERQSMAKVVSSYLSPSSRKPSSETEKTVQFMMVKSLLFESYESWLTHRQAFLQRGIHHAYITGDIPKGNSLFSIIQPVLVYVGLVEQLQRYFKHNNSSNVKAAKAEGTDDRTGLQDWEVIMKEKLLNVKEMLSFSNKLLLWLENMTSTVDLQYAFDVIGALSDVLSGGFSKCEDFVQAAIQAAGRKTLKMI